jgi:hypothetical protein
MGGGSAHLSREEETVKGGSYFSPTVAFIGGGERGLGGPLRSAMDAGVEQDRRIGGAHRSPLLRVSDRWARNQHLKVARTRLP